MESTVESQIPRPAGGIARQLHGRFDGFGAGIGEKHPRVAADGRQRVQALGQLDLGWVIEVGSRHMQEFVGLVFDGFDHGRMAVAGIGDSDTGGEVDIAAAVDIPDFRTAAVIHDEGVAAGIGRRQVGGVAFDIIRRFAQSG